MGCKKKKTVESTTVVKRKPTKKKGVKVELLVKVKIDGLWYNVGDQDYFCQETLNGIKGRYKVL